MCIREWKSANRNKWSSHSYCLLIIDCHLPENSPFFNHFPKTQNTAWKLPLSWGKLEVRNSRHLAKVTLTWPKECHYLRRVWVRLCSPTLKCKYIHLHGIILAWLCCCSSVTLRCLKVLGIPSRLMFVFITRHILIFYPWRSILRLYQCTFCSFPTHKQKGIQASVIFTKHSFFPSSS